LPDFATAVWTAPCTAPWAQKLATGDPHLREVRTPIACQLSGEKYWKIIYLKKKNVYILLKIHYCINLKKIILITNLII
jgi:hypothetical protein